MTGLSRRCRIAGPEMETASVGELLCLLRSHVRCICMPVLITRPYVFIFFSFY